MKNVIIPIDVFLDKPRQVWHTQVDNRCVITVCAEVMSVALQAYNTTGKVHMKTYIPELLTAGHIK